MKKIIIFSVACFIAVLFIGCGNSSVIKGLVSCAGTVTLDGVPLESASINFAPVDASGKLETGKRGGTAISDANGNFNIKTASDSSGITSGTYKVTVNKIVEEKGETNKSPIPKSITGKYSDIDTSDLTVEIPAGGKKNIKLELKLK
ncbi:MAG: hypothetical protein LBP59_00485 [Planctomycetaceae bacterium]|nr:hypothetical protein [Planctomycetaceae bacterium]